VGNMQLGWGKNIKANHGQSRYRRD
jgi:hypothetical protein